MSAGPREADLRVHVRAVHVDLAAVLVDDGADLADRLLEDAVRRGVGHHQRAERVRVLRGLRAQVGDVDVAVRVAGDRHDLEAGHHRARRVRAVGGDGDEAHVAVRVAAARGGTRGSSSRPAYSPCAPEFGCSETAAKPVISASQRLELREHLVVALRLVGRRERVQLAELAATSPGSSRTWR